MIRLGKDQVTLSFILEMLSYLFAAVVAVIVSTCKLTRKKPAI